MTHQHAGIRRDAPTTHDSTLRTTARALCAQLAEGRPRSSSTHDPEGGVSVRGILFAIAFSALFYAGAAVVVVLYLWLGPLAPCPAEAQAVTPGTAVQQCP
ncbi:MULTISPECIES: hypothetical protein [unclassified Rathayibacter]|uniref:hypothetical protein n=1 Tax=unclassified Rathayibacter TaxID=2609250 RepID=UPI0006FE8F2D|nr:MULTISPECIES: hypothetical protein [unclassified Rathayibacter]KQQ05988.1 hypothetical protein ASF42_05470 [Rathayibacter sp. Leaf294]KQS13845.1 hypothetical protein ASG06_05480 [Rathayibacter sp. Leaf185]